MRALRGPWEASGASSKMFCRPRKAPGSSWEPLKGSGTTEKFLRCPWPPGRCLGSPLTQQLTHILNVFWLQPKLFGLGFLPLHLRGGRHGGGSRPALPGLHDVLCRSRSSGSFGLRVAVVEPSAKTLGFRV